MAGKSYGMGSPKSMAKPGKRRVAKANKAMTEKRVGAAPPKSGNARSFPLKSYKALYGSLPPAPGYFNYKNTKGK